MQCGTVIEESMVVSENQFVERAGGSGHLRVGQKNSIFKMFKILSFQFFFQTAFISNRKFVLFSLCMKTGSSTSFLTQIRDVYKIAQYCIIFVRERIFEWTFHPKNVEFDVV